MTDTPLFEEPETVPDDTTHPETGETIPDPNAPGAVPATDPYAPVAPAQPVGPEADPTAPEAVPLASATDPRPLADDRAHLDYAVGLLHTVRSNGLNDIIAKEIDRFLSEGVSTAEDIAGTSPTTVVDEPETVEEPVEPVAEAATPSQEEPVAVETHPGW